MMKGKRNVNQFQIFIQIDNFTMGYATYPIKRHLKRKRKPYENFKNNPAFFVIYTTDKLQ
jgi:hypothetical protein